MALMVGEIYLRLFNPQKTFSSLIPPYDFHCLKQGTYYWLAFQPNSNCTLRSNTNAFSDVIIKTNSLGLRNPEITPDPKGKIRILFIGDSLTVGWGVKENETFPRVTESLLKQKFPDKAIESVNAGLVAGGPGYYYIYLKNDGIKLNPDIVVVGFYMYNDIPANALNSNWLKTDQQGLPEKIDSTEIYVDQVGYIYPKALSFKYHLPILRNLHLFMAVYNVFSPPNPENDLGQTYFDPIYNPYNCLYKDYKKHCQDLEEAKSNTKSLFLGIKKILDQKGKKLLILFIPSEFQLDEDAAEKYGFVVPLLPADRNRPYLEFASFFQDNKIDYIDPRPFLRQFPDKDLYFQTDDHMTALGYQKLAEILSDKLADYLK